MLRFLDTNILLYSISRDPIETTKRDRAVALIDEGDNALSVQVLQEFYVQATRADPPRPAAARCRGRPYWHVVALQGAGDLRADPDGRIGDYSHVQAILLGRRHRRRRPRAWVPRIVFRRHEPWSRDRGGHDHQSVPMSFARHRDPARSPAP
jgi:hypothetical protein